MSELPDSIDNAIKNITDSPTRMIGKVICAVIDRHLRHYLNHYQLTQLIDERCNEELNKRLDSGISQIPADKLINPDPHTILLSLDNLPSCISSEELRNLFANLIAHSCHSDYSHFIHPSFAEVIRQMSPYDAKVLKFYNDTKPDRLITYSFYNDHEVFDRVSYAFDEYPFPDETIQVSLSISSLIRLGILAFHTDAIASPADDSPFKNSDFYKQCEIARVKEGKYSPSYISGKPCVLTPYGQAFVIACLD